MGVRIANLEDAPALARVIVDTGRAAHRGQVPDAVLLKPALAEAYAESEHNWRRSLHRIADDSNAPERIFVAEDETGVVVGLAMVGPPNREVLPNSGEVYVLYVRQSHQQRGLGRQLVQASADHLRQLGLSALLIGCLATNTPARRFYEALGGQVVAEREFDQDGVLLPEVVYGWADISNGLRSETKSYVHKVCPVILRQQGDSWQILAFRHPNAGTQLIKGTLEAGEQPEVGVLRELAEESGIDQARVVEKIGELASHETEQHWHLFLCQPVGALQEEWSFFTTDGGGHIFQFFWHRLDEAPDESWHPVFSSALAFIRAWQQKR